MKKFYSILTAVGFACSLLTAFPAVAEEEQAFKPYADDFLIVVGTKDGACMMQYLNHSRSGYSYGVVETDADFVCGDVLTCNVEMDGWGNFLDTPEFEKVGTYEEYFPVKELTASYVKEFSDEISVYLTDDDGNEGHFTYHKNIDYPFNMDDVREGDTYTFVCYNDSLLLIPLEQTGTGFNWRTDDFFVVAGTKGNSTMLDYYHHYRDYDGEEIMQGVAVSDVQGFACGDILVIDGEYEQLETYPYQFRETPEFRKVNLYDHLTKEKNLTVTDMHSGNTEGEEYIVFYLADGDGNTYRYTQDYGHIDYPVSMADAEIGDTYIFEFYDEFPVAPVEKFSFNHEKEAFFVVTGKNCMEWYYHSGQNCEYFYSESVRESTADFSYGDVLTINGEYWILESYPAQISSKNDLEKAGTCNDFFTVLDLTLTSVELNENPDYWQDSGTFYFVDSDGNEYTYSQDYAALDYGYNLKDAQVGEVYPFYCYHQRALTPVLPDSDGDANGDGTLDILDVITINKAVLGKANLPSTRIPYVDFNGDGIPDATDSLTMLKMIVGLI